jgi:hypothetical protein
MEYSKHGPRIIPLLTDLKIKGKKKKVTMDETIVVSFCIGESFKM